MRLNVLTQRVGSIFVVALVASCAKTSATDALSSSTSELAQAFPSGLVLSSELEKNSSSTALADFKLSDDAVQTSTTAIPPNERQSIVSDILEHKDVSDIKKCFKVVVQMLSQPKCFSANLQRTEWQTAPSDYVVSMPSNVNQLLYGDGGILKSSENGEACSATASNYFTQDAIGYVEVGKQLFAGMICAGDILGKSLPAAGETSDLTTDLSAIEDIKFSRAKISAEASTAGTIYTTEILAQYTADSNKLKTYALFRHQPDANKGHVVVFTAGVPDSLGSANPNGGGDPNQGNPNPPNDPNQQPAQNLADAFYADSSTTTRIAGVSVSYVGNAAGDMQVFLERGNFVSTDADKHPANFIDENGVFELNKVNNLDGGHNVVDNIFNTRFVNFKEAKDNILAKGVIGWTASLGDQSWRSFSYQVSSSASGQEMKATFGYDNMGGDFHLTNAPSGFFCGWAQGGGDPNATSSDAFLSSAGPSGVAQNYVQYQVATRAASTDVFAVSASSSKVKYTVQTDCGKGTSDFDLAALSDATGAVDGFQPPSDTDLKSVGDVLGGLSLDVSAINLDIE